MTDVARFSPARAFAVALIGIGLLSPATARAQVAATIAEALFREAQEKMATQDFDKACDLFARSLKIDPTLGTLLNLAVCHEKQGKIATAWAELSAVQARATRDHDIRRAELALAQRVLSFQGGSW